MSRFGTCLSGLLCSTVLATPAFAQTSSEPTVTPAPAPVRAGAPSTDTQPSDAIVVTGIRASQAKSIDIKRKTDAIVDAITAEDIGKLPDVTIVDSLQRIPGVQIQRDAGEGATVNIRGLPQVVTLLNGEQYLSPGNLGSAQPNLNDIPAQLMGGVVVYKSQDLRNALSGVSGTVDLRTRRPFDFKNGFTVSGQAEYDRGRDTKDKDYLGSALINWRHDDFGVLISGAYSKATLGNNYAGSGGGVFGNNDWGGNGANWIAPHGYETFHREDERRRFGLSGAMQWQINDGLRLTAEGFYTKYIRHDLRAGMNISNRWTGLGWTNATDFDQTSVTGSNGQPWLDVDQYDLDAWWVNSFSINRTTHSSSKNFNVQLDYDRGGLLTFSIRGIYGDAKFKNTNGQVQGDLSNWQYYPDRTFTLFRDPADRTRGTFYPANIAALYPGQYSNSIVGSNGGRYVNPNPLGYAGDPQLHIDISHNDVRWSGFDTPMPTAGGLGAGASLQDYMANLASYRVAAFSSEGNNRNKSDVYALRGDGALDFEKKGDPLFGILSRVDFGARMSRRRTEIMVYHLFSNLYGGNGASDPNGCAAQWKAIDVVLNNTSGCTAGEQVANPNFNPALPVSASNPQTVFQGYTAWRPTPLNQYNHTYFLTDFGSQTRGFPGVWVADPRDFNDPQAFQASVFGNAFPVIIPGSSYDVNFYEKSAYANAVLESGPFRANIGIKGIRTRIKVRQNLTGATVPYGDANYDIGDTYSGRSYWDWLPTINAQWQFNRRLKLRASFAKTMIPLDLGNYGGGLTIATNDAQCDPTLRVPTDAPCGVRQVTSAGAGGNPFLDPWRSNNYDVALEYYVGRASLLNVGLFKLDISSFVTTQTLNDGRFPDGDGVIRRTVPFTRPVQGRSGQIQGLEAGAKIAFSDFIHSGGPLRNFGIDANFTYSPNKDKSSGRQLDGDYFPFQDNSKFQYNAALWYQDAKLQARIAYNRRSPRLNGRIDGIAIFQDTAQYVDANITYALTRNLSLYANASNIFGEIEKYYYQFDKEHRQFASSNEFEPRYSIGIRAKF
jgi:iron complex outermembrane receptor protein